VLLVFLCLGVLSSQVEIRGLIAGLAVLPMAFGAVFAHLANRPWPRFRRSKPALLVLLAVFSLLPHLLPTVVTMVRAYDGTAQPQSAAIIRSDESCNAPEPLAALNTLPPSLIMAPLNLGTSILLYTPHSVTAVPYHRTPQAMSNGVMPFIGDTAAMAGPVQTYRVDLVVVCRDQRYGPPDSMGSRLAAGQLPPWLVPLDLGGGPLIVLKVLRDASGDLATDDGAKS